MSDTFNVPVFPKQAIPDSKKTEDWYKQNIEIGVSLVNYQRDNGLRSDRKEKISNINLFNDIVDREEIETVINPYNLAGKFPDTYKNYPVANGNLNLLFGEERKRLFNPVSYVVNDDVVSSGQQIITEKFNQLMVEQITNEFFDQEQAKKAIQELDRWSKYTYQDMYERMSNQVIQYFINTTDIKEHWSKNFEDLLIQGEELASIDILGGNLVFERLNPLDVVTFRTADSYKVEDSDWIVISKFVPIGVVIDNYHTYLSTSDKDYLEEIYTTKTSGSKLIPDGQLLTDRYNINDSLRYMGMDKVVRAGSGGVRAFNRAFDESGNIRVTRVLWKGQRRIGIIDYKDNEGRDQKKYVDGKYTPDTQNGEKVKWVYISEWNEGTKIGATIYLKYGPRPIQFRDPDNPSICHPGIVGNILNTNSAQAKSLMSYMKPYQLLYNFFMYRLQQDFIKYQGHIAKFNLAKKPDNWSMDKIMFYMQQFGIMIEDPFNEGLEGASTGKLAGTMNESSGSMQIGDANMIQMNMNMLEFLENRIADISGVTPQRKGAISNRETVGGVERSVMQSSNNTEKYFSLHDNFRVRCLKILIGTAAIAWKDKKEKRSFVLDDGTKTVLDFDGSVFMQGTYGVATNASSDVTNMMNEMKALAQPYMQNEGSLSTIMDVFMTKDPASLKRKIEKAEEDMRQRQKESEERQLQGQQAEIDSNERMLQDQRDHELLLKEMELNNKLEIELLKQQSTEGIDNSDALAKISLDKEKLMQNFKLKSRQMTEIERHNLQAESISRMQKKSSQSK